MDTIILVAGYVSQLWKIKRGELEVATEMEV